MKAVYSVVILFCVAVMLAFLLGAFSAYFYPMKYVDEINAVASEYSVSPALIASVANAESGYNCESVSSKGAVGIMQLMPSTAQWLCEKLKLDYDPARLTEPEYSLKLGGYYLSFLLGYFKDEQVAICAYNAGIGNVRAWLADTNYSSDGVTLSQIPFPETRNYLINVEKNLRVYNKKFK